uniref:Uncharacterized protein n=1 Tax=Meloidogyne enterolobii TaxID=390850 RepID=A0A6V7WE51_MELEN|nr:unnamed protein product [Meloidogyne enterolobii]
MNYFSIFLFFISFYFVYSGDEWNQENIARIMSQYEEAKQQQERQFSGLLNQNTNFHQGMESYHLNGGRYEGSNYQMTSEASKTTSARKAKNVDLNGPAPQKAGRKGKPSRSPMN